MEGNKILRIVLFFFTFLLFTSSVYANVEIFSKFDTVINIQKDNIVEINKSLSLKNVYDIGIVPGQVEFKVARGIESREPVVIEDVRAIDQFGNEISTHIRAADDSTVIVLDIYYPLLPGFEYSFDLYYKFNYEPGGIFFKSLQIPIRESTIPINDGEFQVNLPSGYSFTHLSSEGFNETIEGNTARWDIKDDLPKSISFEYSYIPIHFQFARGSYVFWIVVNVVLLVFLLIEVRRAVKRVRDEYGE